MQFQSTRGMSPLADSADAVLQGLAADGGLYLPVEIPAFDWKECVGLSTMEQATRILSAFLPDIPDMPELVKNAYSGKFESDTLTPLAQVGPFHVLELFRGPTSAFKDVALSMLPQLMTAAKKAKNMKEDILILTATSGDTGKAALVGFQDVPGIRICVFYPDGGVSQVQHRQMASQEGKNVTVCAVRGNFDDAQTGVKHIFSDCRDKELPFRLSSANSINIGRLAPQITYYFAAYRDLLQAGKIELGDEVNFSVPTGNFGDILAGYLASRLGLPVGRLICASNANNVLTDFITTGIYDRRRPLHKTDSPSMDILVSSNLERLLYLMSGDTALVAKLMAQLNDEGSYCVPGELLSRIQSQFTAGWCDDAQGAAAIGHVFRDYGYLMDTHTASGWQVAEDYVNRSGDDRPMVVLSTASPYKFPAAVLRAIGGKPEGDEFAQMKQLQQLSGVKIPKNLAGLREKPLLHQAVIDKQDMLEFVRKLS